MRLLISKLKLIIWKSPINKMSVKIYIITQAIQILCIRGIILIIVMTIENSFLQQHYFTYQRKGNQELQIQLLNNIVADLQNQINNSTANSPPDNDEPEIGTM